MKTKSPAASNSLGRPLLLGLATATIIAFTACDSRHEKLGKDVDEAKEEVKDAEEDLQTEKKELLDAKEDLKQTKEEARQALPRETPTVPVAPDTTREATPGAVPNVSPAMTPTNSPPPSL